MKNDAKGIKAGPMKRSRLLLVGPAVAILLVLLFGPPIFLAAGTLKFWNGWLFLGIFAVGSVFLSISNPELAEKRARGMEKENPQMIVKLLLTLCTLAILIISGLDYKNHWSAVPIPLAIVSALIMAGAFGLLSVVMKENRFAARVVEIQEGQKTIDTGTYSIVRHPMYLAFTILFSASAVVLGSWYSLIPALCIPFLLTFRIRDEEIILRNGLAGYDLYMQKVKFRLIPFIW